MKEQLKNAPVIPVITVQNAEDAHILTELCAQHGLNTLEITLRTPAALAIINDLIDAFPQMTIGAGTVNDIDTMEAVVQSQAHFVVSPGFSPALASLAAMYSLPYLPGVASPSEILQAKAFGFDCLKLFPAEVVGGVNWLKSMQPVFPDVVFCPTGGVNLANASQYLAMKNVVSVGLSALTPAHMVQQQDWQGIKALLEQEALAAMLASPNCV